MFRSLVIATVILAAAPAQAETVPDGATPPGAIVAARTLPAGTILTPDDLMLAPGALGPADSAPMVGREALVTIFAGQPVQPSDLGAPTLVSRNQTVPLLLVSGGLRIETEGRALDKGRAGDVVRVMNLGSRQTVTAVVGTDGRLFVGGRP